MKYAFMFTVQFGDDTESDIVIHATDGVDAWLQLATYAMNHNLADIVSARIHAARAI